MPKYTENLNLFKYDTENDGKSTFNVDLALNDNFDKIDAYAENQANLINNKVAKSGDTMTGNLGIKNNAGAVIIEGTGYKGVLAKCTDIDYTSTTQKSLQGVRILANDKNEKPFAYWQGGIGSGGNIFSSMSAKRSINGSEKAVEIACDILTTGETRIQATGNLHVRKSGRIDLDLYNTNFDSIPTTAPSETTYCSVLRSFDKNNRLVGQLSTYTDTGNNANCAITALRNVNGTNVSSTFTVMVKPDGTQTCAATGTVKQEIAHWAYPSTTKISNPIPTTITKDGNHTYTAPCDGLFTFQYSTENAANAVKLYINNIMVYVTGDSQKSTHRMSGAIPVSKGMVIKLNTDTTNATGTNYFWKSYANV